jgi:hypothetical protein
VVGKVSVFFSQSQTSHPKIKNKDNNKNARV